MRMLTVTRWRNVGLLVLGAVATVAVYVWVVPGEIRATPDGNPLASFIAGWLPWTVTFYALGRLVPPPDRLPSMRSVDVGAFAVVLAILLSVGLMSWGFTPERVPEVHALPALAVFGGLASFGWGLGRRSAAIAALSADERP